MNDTFAGDSILCYYPFGLCSRKVKGKIYDLEWKKTFISKAKTYHRDIIPTHISGRNSNFFYNLSNFRKFLGIKAYIEMLYLVNEFYKHNMALLRAEVRADLFCGVHPIYTKVKDEVSTRYGENAVVSTSILADGCMIDGTVERSILFRGVTIGRGAVVRDSIIMQGVSVGEGCELDHVILDKGSSIRAGRKLIGYDNVPIILKKNTVV